MNNKIAKLALMLGFILSLLASGDIIYNAKPGEGGFRNLVDVLIFVGAFVVMYEARTFLLAGTAINRLPANGDYIIEGMPAIELMDRNKKLLPKEDIALLIQLSPKKRSQVQGETRTHRITLRDILPSQSDGRSREKLFELIKTSQPGDEIHIYPGREMAFVAKSIYYGT